MQGTAFQSQENRQAKALAKRLDLPGTFVTLPVLGLEMVAASRELSARNKEMIFRFLNHISPEVSSRRLTFYTHKLRKLGCWLGKDFDAVTETDLRSLLTFLSKGNARHDGGQYSLGTLHGYKVTVKRFYRWLEGDDQEYPRKVRWIKTSGDTTRIKEPEQLLSAEEVLEMIRHAQSPRDKAIVSFLYESGARVAEMLSMNVRHLEFAGPTVKATLPLSKTRPRTIPLVACRRHLATWVNYHPRKDDPDAALWSNLKGDGSNPLTSYTVNTILKGIASKAGIPKRVYPHLFRACSITHKHAAGWPEQAIKLFHGLSKDSKVMKHYAHLSYANLEQIQRKMNGLPTEKAGGAIHGLKCPGCGRTNPLYAELCECGLPTETKIVVGPGGSTESEIEARLEKKMAELVENRMGYDRMMLRFLDALAEKCQQSPTLAAAVSRIKADLEVR